MISLWGMRRKGSLIGRWWPRVPRPREPSGALGQSGDLGGPCSSRPLDRVRKGSRQATCLTPGRTGSLFAASTAHCAPTGPCVPWRPTGQGWKPIAPLTPLAPLGPPPPSTYLRIHLPQRPSRGKEATKPRSDPAFRLKVSIDKLTYAIALLSCAAIGQTPALPSPAMNSCRHSITSSAIASRFGGMVRPSAFAVLRLIAR
jgi:hypothetical protein